MEKCFVIQPFDGGKFDKRYKDIFAPAIIEVGLEPYRVDRDPSVSIPIDDIQTGIEASSICLADITTDNPNVWFELGYAIASQKEVILICSKERSTPFPFDVQHRAIITYATDSSSDFEDLQKKIESRIKAKLQRRKKLGQIVRVQSVAKVQGLDQHHLATLVSIAEEINEPSEGVSVYRIRQSMETAGFTKIATTLGLKALLDNGMLESEEIEDSDYQGGSFMLYKVSDSGMGWLVENQDKLTMKKEPPPASDADDDLPF